MSQQTLLIAGIDPCFCNRPSAVARPDSVLVGIDERVQSSRIDQSFLDQERLQSLDAQRRIRRNALLAVFMIMIVRHLPQSYHRVVEQYRDEKRGKLGNFPHDSTYRDASSPMSSNLLVGSAG